MVTFILCAVLLCFTSVISDRLVPKDTSYGYVPKESQLTNYPGDPAQEWRPFAARDDQSYKNVASDLLTHKKTNFINQTDTDQNRTPSVPQTRSLKGPRFSSEPYYYDPPPPNYLPPSNDPVPFDYTTQGPTDEEFVNRPPLHDDVPQDLPNDIPQGYYYPTPQTPLSDLQPPFAQDDPFPQTPSPQYLPVITANIQSSPGLASLNSAYFPKSNGIQLKAESGTFSDDSYPDTRQPKQSGPLQIEITEMHCFDTQTDGKFQAVLTVKSLNENIPVFDEVSRIDGSQCVVKSDVNPPRLNSKLRINISKSQFSNCAVRDCSIGGDIVHLCVKLRFPTIQKMKLAEDPVLTLQCRTQDRIAAHTKHLQLDVENSASARSGGSVARGGARGGLRSRVGLYRRGARGDWAEALPARARVPLGELLMLRAHVEPEDGWVASRLSSVSLSGGGAGSGGGALSLLGTDGCRAVGARALCPRESRPTPPLGHTLLLRAALFEGMRSGEEVRLSVRMVACLDANDCRPPRCSNTASRARRASPQSLHSVNSSSTELSFKVVLPYEEDDLNTDVEGSRNIRSDGPLIAMLMVLIATIMCSVALIFLKTKGQVCGGGRIYD